jgi:hypothetical protein
VQQSSGSALHRCGCQRCGSRPLSIQRRPAPSADPSTSAAAATAAARVAARGSSGGGGGRVAARGCGQGSCGRDRCVSALFGSPSILLPATFLLATHSTNPLHPTALSPPPHPPPHTAPCSPRVHLPRPGPRPVVVRRGRPRAARGGGAAAGGAQRRKRGAGGGAVDAGHRQVAGVVGVGGCGGLGWLGYGAVAHVDELNTGRC